MPWATPLGFILKLRFALQLARNVGGAIIRGAVEVWSLDQPEQATGC
jgi:hypothetical protein